MKKERNETKELHVNFKLELDNNDGNINNLTCAYTDTYAYIYNYTDETLNFKTL